MSHVSQQIVDAIAVLITGLPLTGANVFDDIPTNPSSSILPCLIVEIIKDDSEPTSMGYPRLLNCTLSLAVIARAIGKTSLKRTLNTIRSNVQTALSAKPSLGGLTKDLQLNSVAFLTNSEAETNYGEATMLWTATYYIQETAPETAL
jgi:hypothetical protein